MALANVLGDRICVDVDLFQRESDRGRDGPGRRGGGRGIYGNQPGEQAVVRGGVVVQQLRLRVDELALTAKCADLAGEQPTLAGHQLLSAPHLVEEAQAQPTVAIRDDDLGQRPLTVTGLAPGVDPAGVDGDDLRLDRDVFVLPEIRQRCQDTPLDVAARVVAQQIATRAQTQRLLQRLGRLGAHRVMEGGAHGRHGCERRTGHRGFLGPTRAWG